jgi:N-acetylglutamate synthase-like GNAT family acetyltransferase
MSFAASAPPAFSEKAFYLSEFRGRTLALALPGQAGADVAAIEEVVSEFAANSTRVVLIGADSDALRALSPGEPVSASDPRWVGALWHEIRSTGRAALRCERPELAEVCRRVCLRLGLAKLVWVDADAVLRRDDGSRVSFLGLVDLESLLAAEAVLPAKRPLLEAVRAMIAGGLPSVSLCAQEELAAELFTYSGSGTFFTRERSPEVRTLLLDDFDAANHLIGQGVREGYLVERSADELELVLANGFGLFIEGRYLAGIGALIPYEAEKVGEIASLYTLTRFLGEGIGGHLVRAALSRARAAGYRRVFACTISERVEGFFVRHGFERGNPEQIPAVKWLAYPTERRRQVRCLVYELGDGEAAAG